ncbi:hypothetical protein [Zooshikella ganghwensis]|uniref:Uncharacterized protein n=1 Tax=Zooshikella ganghwensis TaxID=202772 RepID=A0A4P9VI70_9GAMM|nr:hypothetical protein [Zooshikella ganghwensis]RDH42216.1 hypothetical protein B9G39_01450 [Zooshikella ganghwensis]
MEAHQFNELIAGNYSSVLRWILNELKKEEEKIPVKCNTNKAISLFSYHASINKRHQTLMYAYFVLTIEQNIARSKAILESLFRA